MEETKETSDNVQNKAIEDLRKNIVGWKIFTWAMGFIVVFLGLMCSQVVAISEKVNKTQSEYAAIQTQLSRIQVDIEWIKEGLK